MINLDHLRTRKDVEEALACRTVLEAIRAGKVETFYDEMQIAKRGRRGGFRTVFRVNNRQLAAAQKEIAIAINRTATFPAYVQGFVPEGSTVKNARFHLGKLLVLHVDVSNFFDAIKTETIALSFVKLGCGEEAAAELAVLCTVRGALVQGASSSPAVANVAFLPTDEKLHALAGSVGSSYSRYADDLTFSGAEVPDARQVEAVLAGNGFAVNWEKVRTQRRGKAQFVTGLSVSDTQVPRAPKALKRYLRTFLFYAEKSGLEDHLAFRAQGADESPQHLLARIDGWLSYLYGVERPAAERLGRRWRKLLAAAGYRSRGEWPNPKGKTQEEILHEIVERMRARGFGVR